MRFLKPIDQGKMLPELKARWVAALRSGKYLQGRRALNRDNKNFCCLGVLCEIAFADGVVEKRLAPGRNGACYEYRLHRPGRDVDDWADAMPPVGVEEWAGLPVYTFSSRTFHHDEILLALPTWNDSTVSGVDFKTIADMIEEQL